MRLINILQTLVLCVVAAPVQAAEDWKLVSSGKRAVPGYEDADVRVYVDASSIRTKKDGYIYFWKRTTDSDRFGVWTSLVKADCDDEWIQAIQIDICFRNGKCEPPLNRDNYLKDYPLPGSYDRDVLNFVCAARTSAPTQAARPPTKRKR